MKYKILKRFYHCLTTSNTRSKSARRLHEDIFTRHQHLCLFKTLITCFSFGGVEGAKILGNMGFEPQGENLLVIMVQTGKETQDATSSKIRMGELIKELNIDKNRITWVSHKSFAFASYRTLIVEWAWLWWSFQLLHSHAQSTGHTTTNSHSLPRQTKPAAQSLWDQMGGERQPQRL